MLVRSNSSTEQAKPILLPNMLQEICISDAGDGDEEGREGGEEQQQATGHRPRGGQWREDQGAKYSLGCFFNLGLKDVQFL